MVTTICATAVVDLAHRIGPVPPRLFGSMVEHLGRAVYTGIYEPRHPRANSRGFRTDVLDAVGELGVSVVRYPGGNFVSSYRWEDGVGPVADRPRRIDPAWHCTEPNTFGLDEFMAWTRRAGVEPMLAVNLGTRGVQAAMDLLEYCNIPGGTANSDARRANGAQDPYRVKLWCLGNEMDGAWQVGALPAREYGRLAARTARAMRMVDPGVELVVCGSSGAGMPTFGAWERTVLEEAYDAVDYLSAHAYFRPEGERGDQSDDRASFLASGVAMDRQIEAVVAECDRAQALRGSSKQLKVCFDEWNVWYHGRAESRPPQGDDWPVAPPLLEDHYCLADGAVVGGLLISLLRHADRVRVACLAQLVNVIAPIMTAPGGGCWRQASFHPFAATARGAVGDVVAVPVECANVPTPQFGDVPVLDAVATWDDAARQACVFVVNRSLDRPVRLSLRLGMPGTASVVEAVRLGRIDQSSDDQPGDDRDRDDQGRIDQPGDDHVWAALDAEGAAGVGLAPLDVQLDGGVATAELSPASWAMLRFALG